MTRIVLIDIAGPHDHVEEVDKNLAELRSLVKTYGGTDIARIIQHRNHPDKHSFIGSGKVYELLSILKQERIDVVILNAIVKPTQLFHLTQTLWQVNPTIEVWDRIDLILHIFDKHAQSAEAKLQIEIARMRHMGPRIYGLGGTLLSRQGGGIGGRGEGETNIELMKRHWRDQIRKKREELDKQTQIRLKQVTRRKELGMHQVALVGYTNAGKTTLFNLLTGKQKIVKDALFVTLDSTLGKLKHPSQKTILLSDTIGFIQNLPPFLIDTFKSTLLGVQHADLLLHVVDIADEKRDVKIEVVREILREINADKIPQILVFNKADLLPEERWSEFNTLKESYRLFSPLFISTKEKINIEALIDRIDKI